MSGAVKNLMIVGLAIAGLIVSLIADSRGLEIKNLEAVNAELRAEVANLSEANRRLQEAGRVVANAAQAQMAVCAAAQLRQNEIEEIMAGCQVAAERPQGVVDEKSSRGMVDFLNRDLFAPLGGVRGPAGPGPAAGAVALPGPGSAGAVRAEP